MGEELVGRGGGMDANYINRRRKRGSDERDDSRGAPEPAGTRHKRGVTEGWWWWQEGKKGSSRAVAGQVGAQGQLTSSTRPRKERVKARAAVRYDALDTIPTREGGRHTQPNLLTYGAHHHFTTWMPSALTNVSLTDRQTDNYLAR